LATGYPGRHEAVAAAVDLAGFEVVIDVGGGGGSLLRALLGRYPNLQGVLFDEPGVIRALKAEANSIVPGADYELMEGNFFESVPNGGDVYILSYILHDWPDKEATAILRSCRKAMKPGARLIIIERLLETDPARCDRKDLMSDINMLVMHQGRERTTSQFNELMARSGFSPIRPLLTQPVFSIFEASPV
jgi:ubiquinone/menaquinone biosynthesis C-methylase UbiE